jgi:hypothetical protein
MKTVCYSTLLICLLVVGCKKSDKPAPPSPIPPPTPIVKTEYLLKTVESSHADSILFLYDTSLVLRGIASEYDYNSVPTIESYFLENTGGILQSINQGTDTTGSGTTILFGFGYGARGKVNVSSYYQYGSPYSYDSLAYDASGNISVVYSYAGNQTSTHVLSSVTTLAWDTSGDVTQVLQGDSLGGIATNYTYQAVSTYDTKSNPYVGVNAAWLLTVVNGYTWETLSRHNVTSTMVTVRDPGSLTTSTTGNTFSYTYDSYGNPATAVIVTNPGGSVTEEFVYGVK